MLETETLNSSAYALHKKLFGKKYTIYGKNNKSHHFLIQKNGE